MHYHKHLRVGLYLFLIFNYSASEPDIQNELEKKLLDKSSPSPSPSSSSSAQSEKHTNIPEESSTGYTPLPPLSPLSSSSTSSINQHSAERQHDSTETLSDEKYPWKTPPIPSGARHRRDKGSTDNSSEEEPLPPPTLSRSTTSLGILPQESLSQDEIKLLVERFCTSTDSEGKAEQLLNFGELYLRKSLTSSTVDSLPILRVIEEIY